MTSTTSSPVPSHLTLLDPVTDRDHATAGHPASLPRGDDLPAPPEGSVAEKAGAVPASRRGRGWFGANRGCVGRAALVASGVGIAGVGTTAWTAWRIWRSGPVRRARTVVRFSRRTWRRYRRLRSWLGR